MAMNTGSGPGGLKSEINVTPLVDVVLVLLIIFMVVTPMMQKGKRVALPPSTLSTEALHDGRDEPFVLSLTSDRRLFFEEEPEVKAPALQTRLRQALREQPSRDILLKADESLQVGDVRTVLQSVRGSGVRRVFLAVQVPGKH